MIIDTINAFSTVKSLESANVKQKVLNEYSDAIAWHSSNVHVMDEILNESSIIVKFHPHVSLLDIRIFEIKFCLQNKHQLTHEADFFCYELPDGVKVSLRLLNRMNRFPNVLYVEPNYKCVLNAEPDYEQLLSLSEIDIHIRDAWEITKGSPSVIVAIIDSGIDYNHPDLKDKIWVNTEEMPDNAIDNDNNGYINDFMGWNFHDNNNDPMDHYSHGTHVAGIIAASENDHGIAGIAPEVKLMPLKIFEQNNEMANYSDVISAIVFAYNHGASVVNMSFVGKGYSQSLYDIMNKYEDMDFVCEAGDYGADNDTSPFYPGSYELENIICVASIDEDGSLSSYSDFGIKHVQVAAPGNNIYSTFPNDDFGYYSGTSEAVPYVTGIVALLKSYNTDLTAAEINQAIMNNVKHLESLEGKVKTGGLIDAAEALNSVKQNTP